MAHRFFRTNAATFSTAGGASWGVTFSPSRFFRIRLNGLGGVQMRRRDLRRAMTLAAAGLLAVSMTAGTAASEPASPGPAVFDFQGELSQSRDVDNRGDAAQPTQRQRSLAAERSTSVRWNRYGTPATIVPRRDAAPKTNVASDPIAVARGYLQDNREAFGLSETSINAMDVLVNRPMGQGAYVMLRQRFGDLPSTLDGLAAFGIKDGA